MRLDVTLYAIKEINRCFRAYAVIEERSTSPDVVFDEREIEGHSPARARKTQPLRRSKARDGAKNVKSSIEIAKETKRTRKQQSSFPLDPQITVEKEIPSDVPLLFSSLLFSSLLFSSLLFSIFSSRSSLLDLLFSIFSSLLFSSLLFSSLLFSSLHLFISFSFIFQSSSKL